MKVVVKAKELKKMIDTAKKFVGKRSNDLMSMVFCKVENNFLTAVALDGHKIMREVIDTISDGECSFYIRPDMPSIKGNEFAEIELNGEYTHLTVGDITYRTKQPEGTYYNTEHYFDVADNKVKFMVCFDSKLLKEGLDNMVDEYGRGYVVLKFTGHKEPVLVEGKNGKRVILPTSSAVVNEYYANLEKEEVDE